MLILFILFVILLLNLLIFFKENNMQKPVPKYYTPEEYLANEENADYKSEYYKGEIFNLAGASLNHSQIIGNIHAHLYQHQKKHHCRITMKTIKPKR